MLEIQVNNSISDGVFKDLPLFHMDQTFYTYMGGGGEILDISSIPYPTVIIFATLQEFGMFFSERQK